MEIKAILNKPYSIDEKMKFIVEQNHNKGYEIKETDTAIEAWGTDDTEFLELAKAEKIAENDRLRDEKLNGGVEYNNVLFDSDTDQKINLLATYSAMSDEDTIVWYGMNNDGLLCTRNDLLAIGGLITQLVGYCWNMNAYIKEQIENCTSLKQLDEIVLNYDTEL